MKVDGTVNQPIRQQIGGVTHRPSRGETAHTTEPAARTVPDRLAEVLREADVEVSRAKFEALATEMESIGFPLTRIIPETAIRALFLSNNSVPLTPELLAEGAGEGDYVFHRAEELLDAARALLADRRLGGEMRASVAALVRDLDALTGAEPSAPLTGSALQSTVEAALPLTGFPANLLDNLNAVLLSTGGTGQGSALAEGLGSLLRRSGMVFEWRLLAWYRAGADPVRLLDLICGDLKGALLGFLGAMESHRGKGRLTANLKSLGENARSLLDRITIGQLSHLADNTVDRRTLVFQIPFGNAPERLYAGVSVEGRREEEGNRIDPVHYSLAFEIETSNLGTVKAHLMVSGKTVSATFYLRDGETKSLAEEMAGEFREFLEGRGYETGLIRFGVAGDDSESGTAERKTRRSVNVRG